MKGDPRAADIHCDEEEDDSDMVRGAFEHMNIVKLPILSQTKSSPYVPILYKSEVIPVCATLINSSV